MRSEAGMSLSFEVKESDLLGRIGRMTVGGKSVETPYLFPVIHPVRQAVSTRELWEMGFDGLMTNSLIISRRRREEALRLGIHNMLDYQGVLMTDSGGYQVLEYGDVGVDYRQVAEFQSKIGSDVAVTLDRPTGYDASRSYAEETVEYSLKNAVATRKEFGDSKTVWVGPVQGGLYPDLVKKSASELLEGGFDVLALGSPTQVMQNYKFPELVGMIVATRRAIPYAIPLHLFGAGHPLTMALSVALGCDTFDSASYILFARKGRYMTERGVQKLEEMGYLPCSCRFCNETSVKEILEMQYSEKVKTLALHNLMILKKEMSSCKEAIREGRLWDLVEERANGHPMLFEAFIAMGSERKMLEGGTPAHKDRGLMIRGTLDLMRPELAAAARRLSSARRRTESEAILLLTGNHQPLGLLDLDSLPGIHSPRDWYRLHPVLGVYPVELDFAYPFTQTVTSGGEPDPNQVKSAVSELQRRGYERVRVVRLDKGRRAATKPRSRRSRKGSSPSPRSASVRPRSPRRP